MSDLFLRVALCAIADISADICALEEIPDEDTQQKLFNAIMAAITLGATGEQIAVAMEAGVPE